MHYGNLVIIEKPEGAGFDAIEAAVEQAMGPDESSGGFWDWYQIGGRWTGSLDGFDPEKAPENIETCDLCGGTGKRKDMEIENGCNGCSGKGKREKWPTQWAKHPGDVAPIETLTPDSYKLFYRVVLPYGRHYEGARYEPWQAPGKMFPPMEMPPLDWLKKEYAGHLVVVVDNHS